MLNNNDINTVIQGCISCNRISQKEFYKTYYGYCASICLRYVHNEDVVVEVVNDGFIKIFKELNNFKITAINVETRLMGWIKVIMINTSIDYYRRNKKNDFLVSNSEIVVENYSSIEETPIDKLSYYEVLSLTEGLFPLQKIVFNMHVVDGISQEDVAKHLNISIGTVKSSVYRARHKIMELIQSKYKKLV